MPILSGCTVGNWWNKNQWLGKELITNNKHQVASTAYTIVYGVE